MNTGFRNLHPVTGIIFYIAFFAFALTATHPLCLSAAFLCAFFYYLKTSGKTAVKFLLKIILPIILISAFVNGFFNHQGSYVLFRLPDSSPFTLEAVIYGLVFAVRTSSVLLWLGSFNEVITSDKINYIFRKFSPKTGLVISMTLRFIPLVFAHSEEIEKAAKGMGEAAVAKNFFLKMKLTSKRLSILVTRTLERGIDTVNSMKARGYGLKGRSSYKAFRFSKKDLIFTLIFIVGALSFFVLYKNLTSLYIPEIFIPMPAISDIAAIIFSIIFMTTPLIYDITEERKWSISV